MIVHFPPEEVIRDFNDVTLVCLVTSPQQLNPNNISWTESENNNRQPKEASNTILMSTSNDFRLMSVCNTTREKWNSNYMFECRYESGGTIALRTVSKAMGNSIEC